MLNLKLYKFICVEVSSIIWLSEFIVSRVNLFGGYRYVEDIQSYSLGKVTESGKLSSPWEWCRHLFPLSSDELRTHLRTHHIDSFLGLLGQLLQFPNSFVFWSLQALHRRGWVRREACTIRAHRNSECSLLYSHFASTLPLTVPRLLHVHKSGNLFLFSFSLGKKLIEAFVQLESLEMVHLTAAFVQNLSFLKPHTTLGRILIGTFRLYAQLVSQSTFSLDECHPNDCFSILFCHLLSLWAEQFLTVCLLLFICFYVSEDGSCSL